MRSVASALFSEAASASSTPSPAMSSADKAPVQDFDNLLSDRSREATARNPSPVEQKKPEDRDPQAEDDAAVKAAADDQKDEQDDKEQKKDEADTAVLSSCLAMWQMLPPTEPAPVVAGEIGTEPEEVSAGIEETENGAGETMTEVAGQSTAEAAGEVPAAPAPETLAMPEAASTPVEAPAQMPTSSEAALSAETPAAQPAATVSVPTTPIQPPPGKTIVEVRETKAERATRIAAENARPAVDGITVAKQQRTMPEPVSQLSGKTVQAGFAEGEKAESPKAVTAEEKAEARAAVRASAEGISTEATVASSEAKVPEVTSITAAVAETKQHAAAQVAETKAVAGSEATKLIEHIERTVARMRTQGERHIELRMEMSGGEEVRIKLQMEQGQMKTTFKTDSEGLRQALEQSWSQFSQASAERSAKVGTVVFESPAMQTGTGGFQQSPQQREQNASRHVSTPEFPSLGRRANAQPVTGSSSTATTSGANPAASGLQIYA